MSLNREAIVRRRNPVLLGPHPTDTLTVGNGEIAMTVDVTGLQSLPALHEIRPDPHRIVTDGTRGLPEQKHRPFDRNDFQIPLRTQSSWGWYSTRPTREFSLDETVTFYPTARGPVPYYDRMGLQRASDPIAPEFEAGAWFHYNPRRMHLGRLALVERDGSPVDPTSLSHVRTELDLWTGTVIARFQFRGEPVEVTTAADPSAHRFATRVRSGALSTGLAVAWVFDTQPDPLAAFELPLSESTEWTNEEPGAARARRVVESSVYDVDIVTTGRLTVRGDTAVTTSSEGDVEVVVGIGPGTPVSRSTFSEVIAAARQAWAGFWMSGAAASFDGSSDPRAEELERRIVLSQYLTAVNGSGTTPPAETGLTYNTWTGKFHLEMHWWHAAHYPMWGRGRLLERSLGWYHAALPAAQENARRQGYRGGRWPKQTDPTARESPSNIGVFLIWQQPHLIYLLELLYREGRDVAFLKEHLDLVEATADFMADFAEDRDGVFSLPAPLIPAQESYLSDRETNEDPTFELAYWSWALGVANQWRLRLDLPPNESWARVSGGMRAPAVLPEEGGYAALATPPHLIRKDHPSMLMALGWLPATDIIDRATMAVTLDAVWERWDLQTSWGWDYPVLAMTACALGDTARALEALLLPSPKNVFLANGHNPQIPGFLSLYLPANGGLLAAVAHLAAAIEGGATLPEGWRLEVEGFTALPGHPTTDPND